LFVCLPSSIYIIIQKEKIKNCSKEAKVIKEQKQPPTITEKRYISQLRIESHR